MLNYLSRYVFRIAISKARILGMDDTHVVFRSKDRRTDTWQTIRLPGVDFLRRFLQHVLPRRIHKVRYHGLWHSSKRDLASRAWLLLMLQRPTNAASNVKIADLVQALSELAEGNDDQYTNEEHHDDAPCCPHCGSARTRLLAEWPRFSVP